MKMLKFLAAALVIMAFLAGGAQAEMIFGVKPAAVVQSSYFGFLAGTSMVIEFGLDYARVGVDVKGETDGDLGFQPTEIDAEGSASMMMPHGGAKLYLKPRAAGATAPYFLVDIFKAFTSVDLGQEDDTVQDAEEFAADLLSPFGVNLGFGAEYNFSDRFSMGGEYGFRYMMSSSTMDEIDLEVSTSLGMTYAAITANFTF
jgi:hypothetical protein